MRDPLTWSIPIGRLFGITVRVHVLLIVVFLGIYLRVAASDDPAKFPPGTGPDMLIFLGLLLVSVLLHEFGHCYGAHLVDGEAHEILLWPLGGLAYVDVPHTPWANFIATVMGPAVNLFLCLVAGSMLASAALLPPLNPFTWDFFSAPIYSWAQANNVFNPKYLSGTLLASSHLEWWQLLAARVFFINWTLLLLNVLIWGYPLDGGRMFQQILWPRLGYYRATQAAVYSGFCFMLLIGVYSLFANEVLALALAMFIFVSCKQQWLLLETGGEDALFGYDFSQGYTSLERDQPPPPPRRKRLNFFQRWLQRRSARRLQRELETQVADELRMDQLLEKIQRQGRQSLTDEENRFLKRVADKYRNRPEEMLMAELIQPRTLKGFRDYPPALMLPREHFLEQARRVYRSYGFAPIDTPALEYAEILAGQGGAESDKQMYRFSDHGGRDVALRFDLTVPFARFAAEHIGKLGTPFKRYHMGPVWRGENTQRGRYREFWQCDFDTIGTTANSVDIETALVINDLMLALGLTGFRIHVNNRLVLNGLLEELGLAGQTKPVLIALDKLPKVGAEGVREEMAKAGLQSDQAARLLDLAQTQGTNTEVLERLRRDFGSNAKAAEGIGRLQELIAVAEQAGVPGDRLRLDLAIARGLDYYTGTVYETFLTDLPAIGSVCSGGRYDNLAGLFTRQQLPGIGASLGLDRLLAALEELKVLPNAATPAPVLMVQFSAERLGDYQKMARSLRAAGIGVEVYPEARKVGQQLQYAEKRGYQVALIAGPDEFAQGQWKVKDLAQRAERTVAGSDLPETIRAILHGH